MRLTDISTCYRCEANAVGREHIPPLCLFPEAKDVDGVDLRTNLITVPSCDTHNTRKSKDDEFLMVALAGIVGNNTIGYRHSKTKVKRALDRRAHLLNSVFKDYMPLVLNNGDQEYPVIIGSPDFERFERCFQNISYGLYLHEYGVAFRGQCKVFLGFITYTDPKHEKFKEVCQRAFHRDVKNSSVKGHNPQIFQYQFTLPDKFGIIGLKMILFGGTEIYVSFIKEGIMFPTNIGMKLLLDGVKTFIQIDDNDPIEFN